MSSQTELLEDLIRRFKSGEGAPSRRISERSDHQSGGDGYGKY
jgi:hypothetical protein